MNSRWVHSMVYDPTPEQFAKAREDFARAGMLGFPVVGSMPSTPDAIQLNPKLEVIVVQGAYDPLGGCSINAERARHLDPRYRGVQFRCYDGGHMVYRDTPARTLFSNDVKSLMRAVISHAQVRKRLLVAAG
jgi:hypothetical protein